VAERVRRLEESGVITGYACEVDAEKLTVRTRSMRHLEEVTGRIGGLDGVTTSVVYSSPLPRRSVLPAAP
jgi:Lrp/AsnC family transcriptional regulator, leucine-responsive regulatory protein